MELSRITIKNGIDFFVLIKNGKEINDFKLKKGLGFHRNFPLFQNF